MAEYPAGILGGGTAVLGGLIGATYATEVPVTMCKLFGTIQTASGDVPGKAGTTLTTGASSGNVELLDVWNGVVVKAALAVADSSSGKIVAIDSISTTTNASGYFELYVVQGLAVTVTCPSFGKSVAVDTTGFTSVDLSTFF